MGYIVFSSEANMFIVAEKTWDGTIEYSFDNNQWKEWRGEKIINNVIYMRGIKNTKISNGRRWSIFGADVHLKGNIENLLNYKTVLKNKHPKIQQYALAFMFDNCKALTEALLLLPANVTKYCCAKMFSKCKNLVIPPTIISNSLVANCYNKMFENCLSLYNTPSFPNLTIAKEAITNQGMFTKCPSLTTVNINNKLYDINVLKLL